MRPAASLPLLLASCLAACTAGGAEVPASPDARVATSSLTYYTDTKAIIDEKCVTCHRPGDIGPFPLTSYAEVKTFAGAVRASVEDGTMPPWKPADECRSYLSNFDLTPDERARLLEWLQAGAVEGDPSEAPDGGGSKVPAPFVTDIRLPLPAAYTPAREPDDYHCQLIPWPSDATRFVTGLRVAPDQRAIVHHVIVFMVGPDKVGEFKAYDDAEPGPGYTCYGGPRGSSAGGPLANVEPAVLLAALNRLGIPLADLRSGNITEAQLSMLLSELGVSPGGFASIGSWVPGAPANPYPAGTGIRVEPGSMLVVQMHYNTRSSTPMSDRSVVEIATTDAVEREATMLQALDLGWLTNGFIGDPMTIPAGNAMVEHSTVIRSDSMFVKRARDTLGLAEDAALVIHTANHHMHELGKRQRTEIRHADAGTTCVLDIPDWDFAWQGSYSLREPVTLRSGDALWMGCTWDNSAANQPVVEGKLRAPVDVAWGEGSADEMCLGAFYVTRE